MLSIGVIGCGHWGPNLARNFSMNPRTHLTYVCDSDSSKAESLSHRLKGTPWVTDYCKILAHDDTHAVAIATPQQTHYQIVKEALEAGKHVFVEKPLTLNRQTSLELIGLAESLGLVLMVGYVFLFNNAVRFAKQIINEGDLGDVYYVQGVRTNLGPIRTDTNCLWDLASHDISIMLYWLEQKPMTVNANGSRFLGNPFEDVALARICFEKGQCGFLHVSWLDPCKVRQITVVGSKRMLLFDDMSPSEPIKIYDKGVTRETFYDSYGSHRMSVRNGDIVIPPITAGEPLFNECEAFVEAVLDNRKNDAIGLIPLKVDSILQAMDESLVGNGMLTEVKS